ncbi:MAG TPA: type II secretion system protein [Candidatus Acidoferrales bacterium]|nr:type II secretion system protein [Candidatus Acidoferrales bacterium]
MAREAGFTLVETLVGAAIAAAILWGMLAFTARIVAAGAAASDRVNAAANAGRLIERLSSEAASAFAVYVPATDALGASNADGHELDFFTMDGAHRSYAWSYTFDASSKTLTRYALVPGGAPLAGDTLSSIDSFTASPLRVTQLGGYDALFAGAAATDVPYTFTAMPGAIGGNQLVAVQITASGVDRSVLLASEDAPTAFTVVVDYTPSPAPVVTATPSPIPMTNP